MKSFKIKLGYAFCILLTCVFISCDKVNPKQKCKYDVLVGGNGINSQFKAYSFKDSCGYVIFVKKDSTVSIYLKERVTRIEINAR